MKIADKVPAKAAQRCRAMGLAGLSLAALVASAGIAAANPLALNLYVVRQFQGAAITDTGSGLTGYGFIPPDMGGAVANGDVAQMVNDQFRIMNMSGQLLAAPISLDQFYANLGVNNYTPGGIPDMSDPRIIYDPASQRWYASAITTANFPNNTIVLAVSKSSNILGGFTGYSINAKSGQFADFPTLGVNHGAVTIGANNFDGTTGSYTSSSVVTIPKAQLVRGVTTLSGVKMFTTATKFGFTPQAVTSTSGGNKTVLLSNIYGSNGLLVSTIANNASGHPHLQLQRFIPGFSGNLTNAPTQPGGTTYDPGDNRISSGVYQAGNYIYAVNSVLNGTRDQIQYAVLNATSDNLIKSGFISLANEDLTYGSISGNAAGTFVIGFNGSGSTTNISDYATVCSVNIGCKAPSLLFTGLASNYNQTFGGPSNRWGDYSWTAPDLSNPKYFWLFEEYPVTNGFWGTSITEVLTGVPEPGSLALLLTGVIGLAGITWRRKKSATTSLPI